MSWVLVYAICLGVQNGFPKTCMANVHSVHETEKECKNNLNTQNIFWTHRGIKANVVCVEASQEYKP
jgi:hypothetical protein